MANHGIKYTERRAITRENMLACQKFGPTMKQNLVANMSTLIPVGHGHSGNRWTEGASRQRQDRKRFKTLSSSAMIWMPISGRHDLTGPIEEVRQAAEDAGRDPATLEFGQFGTQANQTCWKASKQLA